MRQAIYAACAPAVAGMFRRQPQARLPGRPFTLLPGQRSMIGRVTEETFRLRPLVEGGAKVTLIKPELDLLRGEPSAVHSARPWGWVLASPRHASLPLVEATERRRRTQAVESMNTTGPRHGPRDTKIVGNLSDFNTRGPPQERRSSGR